MRDQQQMDSIDEIFRQTFGNLPPTPSADGWDSPSEKVWNQVQAAVQHRDSHWSRTRQWVALAALAVAVTAGIYFSVSSNNTTAQAPEIPSPVAPTTKTVVTAPAVVPSLAPVNTPTPAGTNTARHTEDSPTVIQPSAPAPVPGTGEMPVMAPVVAAPASAQKPAAEPSKSATLPNVVERRKEVARIKATIGKWTPTLPAHRKMHYAPAVPSSLKEIGK